MAEGAGLEDGAQMSSSAVVEQQQAGYVENFPERPTTAERPGTAMSQTGQCDGSQGMMSLVSAHLNDILRPFAENVEELHKHIFTMTDNIQGLRTQVDDHDSKLSQQEVLLTGVRTDLDQTLEQFQAMQTSFETTAAEQKAEAAELRATASKIQANFKQTLDKLDAVNALTQNEIAQLQRGMESSSTNIAKLEKVEKDMLIDIQGSKDNIDSLKDALKLLDKRHAETADTVAGNKKGFDQHVLQHIALDQEFKEHCVRFGAFVEETNAIHGNVREHFADIENTILQCQQQTEQNREEASKTHNDAVCMLTARLDTHDEQFDSTAQRFDKVEERIGEMHELTVQNGENTSKLVKLSDERRLADVESLRKQVDDGAVDASRHSRLITELQEIVHPRQPSTDGKNHVESLLDGAKLFDRRHVRLEQMFGLDPLTDDTEDCDAGLSFKNGILLTNAQIEDFSQKFTEFDADGSGSICSAEVHAVLKSLGHHVELDVVQFIMNDLDSDRSGAIVFDEFCSLMSKILGPDGKVDVDGYLKQVSEMAKREAKMSQMTELLPVLKKDVEEHSCVIQQEQSKLSSTSQRVGSLEGDHAALAAEVEKLRTNLNANNEYWKGLSQGLKETKKTVRAEGEGGMLPSVRNLRNLPPLEARTASCSAASKSPTSNQILA